MKTAREIKERIDRLIENRPIEKDFMEHKEYLKVYKKMQAEVLFYNDCLKYLEGGPSQEFVQKMKDDIERIMESKQSQFNLYIQSHPETTIQKELEKKFEAEMGFPQMKLNLKYLNFILT